MQKSLMTFPTVIIKIKIIKIHNKTLSKEIKLIFISLTLNSSLFYKTLFVLLTLKKHKLKRVYGKAKCLINHNKMIIFFPFTLLLRFIVNGNKVFCA